MQQNQKSSFNTALVDILICNFILIAVCTIVSNIEMMVNFLRLQRFVPPFIKQSQIESVEVNYLVSQFEDMVQTLDLTPSERVGIYWVMSSSLQRKILTN